MKQPSPSFQITHLMNTSEHDLKRLRDHLALLKTELAERELALATLKAELHAFEILYMETVGSAIAALDQVRVRIQVILSQFAPHNETLKERVRQARQQANESTRATEEAHAAPESQRRFQPDEELKALFRKAAKKIHPDLAIDSDERELRTRFMAKVNLAYLEGDGEALQQILTEWELRSEASPERHSRFEYDHLSAQIEAISVSIQAVIIEIERLHHSEPFSLWQQFEEAKTTGRDLLNELLGEITRTLHAETKRLESLIKQNRDGNE